MKASVQRRIRQSIADEVGLLLFWAFYISASNSLWLNSKCYINFVLTKASLLVQYPGLEPVLDDLLPKKAPLIVAKWFVIFLYMLLLLLLIIDWTVCFSMFIFRILQTCFWHRPPFPIACSQNHLNLVLVNNVPLFFNIRDGPYMPTLRLLHQCKCFCVKINYSMIVVFYPGIWYVL